MLYVNSSGKRQKGVFLFKKKKGFIVTDYLVRNKKKCLKILNLTKLKYLHENKADLCIMKG